MILVCLFMDPQIPFEEHLSVLTAAKQLPGDITVLLLGQDLKLERFKRLKGIQKIWAVELREEQLANPEVVAPIIAERSKSFHYVLSSGSGKSFLPRVAGMLGVAMLSDVQAIQAPDRFVRLEYAGQVSVSVQLCEPLKLLSIQTSAFPPKEEPGEDVLIEKLIVSPISPKAKLLAKSSNESLGEGLRTAKRVVAGGRGVNAKSWPLLKSLAKEMNAIVGGSHPSVAGGYLETAQLIGQTGVKVSPELYIALGISGAIQHIAGIRDAKHIVAINRDPKAAIFEVADYGLVGDLDQILPELVKGLATKKE